MRTQTILKRLKEIKHAKNGQVAFKKLDDLIEALEFKLKSEKEKKERYGKGIQHLMGWYLNLWNNTPPESFGRTNYQGAIGKVLRELIIIYENNNLDIEALKKDYEEFKNNTERQKQYLLGDKSITRFRTVLPTIKGKQKEKQKKWTSSQNERGMDYYIDALKDDEDIPF